MLDEYTYFCPMRKVRVYLKKQKNLSTLTRAKTYSIFNENTQYYLEGKITRKFFGFLAEELLHQGDHYQVWLKENDSLPTILRIVFELENIKSEERISQINMRLIQFLQKRKQKFSLTSSITAGLEKLAQSYVGLLSISSRI